MSQRQTKTPIHHEVGIPILMLKLLLQEYSEPAIRISITEVSHSSPQAKVLKSQFSLKGTNLVQPATL